MASNFEFYSPTRVIFGKGTEQRVGALVREYGGTRVLIVYGGKSAVRSGVLDRAEKSLAEAGISSWTLGGVVPNPPPRQGLRGHPHRQREQHRLPAGRGRRQRHRHGQGHRLRPGRAGKGRLGAVRAHPHGQEVPAGGQHPDHRGGGQRNIQQQRHHPGGHPPEAGLQRRHQPPEVRPHGPRAHQDPARLSDRVRLRRHHDAHHGALFHQWRQYGVDRRAGRGPAAHRDEERGHPPHRPGQLRAAGE